MAIKFKKTNLILPSGNISINWSKAPRGLTSSNFPGAVPNRELVGGKSSSSQTAAPAVSPTPYGNALDTSVVNTPNQRFRSATPTTTGREASYEALYFTTPGITGNNDVIGAVANGNNGYAVYIGSTTVSSSGMYGNAVISTSHTHTPGKPNHILVTTTGTSGTISLYVNGVLASTGADGTSAFGGGLDIILAGGYITSSKFVQLVMSNYYVGTVLTADEVRQRYLDPFGFISTPSFSILNRAAAAASSNFFTLMAGSL